MKPLTHAEIMKISRARGMEGLRAVGAIPPTDKGIRRQWLGLRPVGGFHVCYIDPPWRFDTHSEKGQKKSPSQHYPTMTAGEVLALPVPLLLADNAAVYCWTTIPHLELGILCLTAWGVTYRGHRAWPKARQTMGYWTFGCHEILLIGAKGSGICPKPGTQPISLIGEPDQREHSRKPDSVIDELDRAHPTARKIEVFGRSPAPGWVGWGNEYGRFHRAQRGA